MLSLNMKITLFTIGKNNDTIIQSAIERYVARISHYAKFDMKNLPDAKVSKSAGTEVQKQAEGTMILASLKPYDFVVLLDERGKEYTSREFATMLEKHFVSTSRNMVFIIGGPYGFSPDVYARADMKISLSRMTLTHEMVRLLFVEQLYRACTIIRGESYHHD